MSADKTVLVTGMSGLIGGFVAPHLAERYRVRALNRRPVQGFETVRADIVDLDAIRPAFENVETVVHLAGLIDGADSDIVAANINGTYNVLEAARQAGVKRVVFASTGSVTGGYGAEEPYRSILAGDYAAVPDQWRMLQHDDPVRPNGMYAASKAAGEAIGRCYTELHGLSVICLRLGRVEPKDRPLSAGHMVVLLAHRDCIQLIDCAIEAPDSVRFDIFFGTSANKWGIRDLEHAREVIGYRPQQQLGDWPESPSS
jgi:nucleoside-diphosphate-sugar epimerase